MRIRLSTRLLALFAYILLFAACQVAPPTGLNQTVLAVRTRTPSGAAVPGAKVELLAEGDNVEVAYVTGSTGEIMLFGITPGVYYVGVRQPPAGYTMPPTQSSPVRVILVQNQEKTVDFTLVRQ